MNVTSKRLIISEKIIMYLLFFISLIIPLVISQAEDKIKDEDFRIVKTDHLISRVAPDKKEKPRTIEFAGKIENYHLRIADSVKVIKKYDNEIVIAGNRGKLVNIDTGAVYKQLRHRDV